MLYYVARVVWRGASHPVGLMSLGLFGLIATCSGAMHPLGTLRPLKQSQLMHEQSQFMHASTAQSPQVATREMHVHARTHARTHARAHASVAPPSCPHPTTAIAAITPKLHTRPSTLATLS